MALRVTIRKSGFDPQRNWIETKFDVDLITHNEFEFVDEDLEAMIAAQSLGLDDYDLHLQFYDEYTQGDGFYKLTAKLPQKIYDALEAQGYDSFNHGDFSREQFTMLLTEIIRDTNTESHRRTRAINIIGEMVDFSGADAGPFSVEDYVKLLLVALEGGFGNTEDIIETLHPLYYTVNEEGELVDEDGDLIEYDDDYVSALISALSHAEVSEIETILDELMLYIDEDDVEYKVEDITNPYAEQESHRNFEEYEHKIEILGNEVFKWKRAAESEICDPIGFNTCVTDYEEHSDEWAAPWEASTILNYFNIDEEEPDDPDDPEHPTSDEDGEFGVLYTKYDYDWQNDKRGEIEEQILVPYEDESDANAAIELSKYIFEAQGSEHKAWDMTLMERKTEEELKEQEFIRRQLTFGPEYEVEPHPIFDQWRVYGEDDVE